MNSHPLRGRRSAVLRYLPVIAAIGFGGALLLSQPVKATPINLAPDRTLVWKDFLGVNAHFLWFTPQQYQQQIAQYQKLGLEWVRVDLHWDRLEPSEGHYTLDSLDQLNQTLISSHLKSLFYMVGSAPFATTAPVGAPYQDQYPPRDPQVYAQRMALLAKRYPDVDAWQVWNEQNLPNNWRPKVDPAGYARLLLATTQALTAAAPGKTLVIGGMAYYSQMPDQGGGLMLQALGQYGVQKLGAVAAYHPYSATPETDTPGKNEVLLRGHQLNDMLHGAGITNIWATEWGWSSYAGPKEMQAIIGLDGQADYTLRRLALMSTLDYQRTFLFALSDLDNRASARDRGYGLLDLNGQPKPVYNALARFLKITGSTLKPGTLPTIVNAPDSLYSVAWTREDGKHLWLYWSAEGTSLTLPDIKQATLFDPLTGTQLSLQSDNGIQPSVKPTLQIVVW
ncbi:beta-xylosidase [Pseudomonas sp. NA-150]|uniref:beta-xylosidase n=1 Tax=Pseudomonas sp. NA-150 TaxID=3367525 RepID=UPI0037CAC947